MINSNLLQRLQRILMTIKNEDFCVFGKFLYYDLQFTLKAHNKTQSKRIFKLIERYKKKFFFLGFIQYEFYKYFEEKNYKSEEPYLCFFAFKKRQKFEALQCDEYKFLPEFLSFLDKKSYERNFKQVKKAIARGQSYQVNLTQSFEFETKLDSFALFNLLLKRQDTSLKAYIKSDFLELLSFSPELFFKIHKRKIITKPMKGTAPRSKNKNTDRKNKQFLQKDSKNLSENVMIVDLLRNDISKLICKKSMKTKLFKVKSYPTLHQMISKIKGKLKHKQNFYEIFKALFPCGSITGAPKIETLKLIENLEKRKRGVYCGVIGLIYKNKSKFNVAIRTIEKRDGIYKYSVGSGVVWDSDKDDEFKELKLKAKILKPCPFYLFETMLFENSHILFFKKHLQRLINSAVKFGFETQKITKNFQNILNFTNHLEGFENLSLKELNQRLFNASDNPFFYPFNEFSFNQKKILRLKLYKNGNYEFEVFDLGLNSSDILLLSEKTLDSKNDTLFHKSSLRKLYETQSYLYKQNLCFDVAFFNEKRELCEGSRSNLVLKKHDEFFTPDLQSGLLNGIYRQFLLQRKLIKEKKLYREDLFDAEELYCINSVRGLKKVKLKEGLNF